MLKLLQDALIEATAPGRDTAHVGPFVAMLNPDHSLIYFNYAVPIAEPTDDDVSALIAHFQNHNRAPRLEFFADLWPGACAALERAGFTLEKEMPIMTLAKSEWNGFAAPIQSRMANADDVPAMRRVCDEAFGMESDPSHDQRSMDALEAGHMLGAVGFIEDELAGCGWAVGTTTIREVAGVATKAVYRRRGVAASVIACLLEKFFADGGEIAWLTPGDDGAESVYSRVGFKEVGRMVCYQMDGG